MVNAELDSLLGPILKVRADQAGVVLTHTDGDEPGRRDDTASATCARWWPANGRGRQHQGHGRLLPRRRRRSRGFAETHDQDARKVTSFPTPPNFQWRRRCWPMRQDSKRADVACTVEPASPSGRLAHLLPAERCSPPASSTTALGAVPHTGAFVIVDEESPLKKVQLATTNSATARSMSSTRRFTCRTSR